VENGHTVPALETLEKFAHGLEIPMYQLFYEGETPPKLQNLLKRKTADDILWGNPRKDARTLTKFCRLFSHIKDSDFGLVLYMAQRRRNGRLFDV